MFGTSTVRAAGRVGVSLLGNRTMVAETLAITSAMMLMADSIRIFLSGVMFGLGVLRPSVNVFPDMLGIVHDSREPNIQEEPSWRADNRRGA